MYFNRGRKPISRLQLINVYNNTTIVCCIHLWFDSNPSSLHGIRWNFMRTVISEYNRFDKHVAFGLLNLPTPRTVFYYQVLYYYLILFFIIHHFLNIFYFTAVAQSSTVRLCFLKEHVTLCRSILKFNDCHFLREFDRLLDGFRCFRCSSSRGSIIVLIRKFCMHILQRETDSKLISTEYKGLAVGNKFLEILDRYNVSCNYQIITLKILVNDFGLNMLKYDTWNAELPLCECGEYDTNEHLVSYSQLINRHAFKNVLIEEEMPVFFGSSYQL